MNAVELRGVGRRYGDRVVVQDLDLEIEEGTIVSLLGPNGAGKTTTVEMIEGQRRATSGSIRTLGEDPASRSGFARLRKRIGVAAQAAHFEPTLTVGDLIRRQASYYSTVFEPATLLSALALEDYVHARAGSLSGGTAQRLGVALALVGSPDLVILDEPTAGLDPVARRSVVDLMRSLRAVGVTVLLTSHNLDEVQEVADRVILLQAGRIRHTGTAASIIDRSGIGSTVEFHAAGVDPASLPAGATIDGDLIRYDVADVDELLSRLRQWEAHSQRTLSRLSITHPSLNDAYVQLVGEDAR